jgi:hypothetical protein
MDMESLFFTIFIMWYFNQYGAEKIFNTFNRLHNNAINFLELFSLYFEKYNEDEELEDEIKDETLVKTALKYEDKFLENIRNMNKEYEFTEEEILEESQKFDELLKNVSDERVYQINQICDKMSKIELKLTKYERDDKYFIYHDDDEDYMLGLTKEERVDNLFKQLVELNVEKKNLEERFKSQKYQEEELIKIKDDVRKIIIDKRLDKLENCYVMEFTPLGNVLMKYDKNKESFTFYSDNTIPYRYLEVVGRKYVKQFNCRPIFVDMEEELKLSEEKWEKEKEEKNDEEMRQKEDIKNQTPLEEKKKNVFAKFKSYNKESGTGHVATSAPPKNSIPNKKLTPSQENEKTLLKQKANRYTYEGKFANFNFMKKIDRKVVDKKFAMTFADFKKSILKK